MRQCYIAFDVIFHPFFGYIIKKSRLVGIPNCEKSSSECKPKGSNKWRV